MPQMPEEGHSVLGTRLALSVQQPHEPPTNAIFDSAKPSQQREAIVSLCLGNSISVARFSSKCHDTCEVPPAAVRFKGF